MAGELKTHPESNTIPVEPYDVFKVMQLTRGTALENHVAADWVSISAHQKSNVHRHNFSETVLFIVSGTALARVGEKTFQVNEGDQIIIRPTEYHGFTTSEQALVFISIQSPPILNKTTGVLDLEPLQTGPLN